jgi:hypothetical protein
MDTGNVVLYVVVVGVVAAVPLLADIFLAYWSRSRMRGRLVNHAAIDQLSGDELQAFLKELGSPPPGISGLARSTMALTVIVVLGIAVIHILATGQEGEDSQIVENILSMLAGLLAAITGFYFGGRASEKAVSQTPPTPAQRATPPESQG